jgi:hypothetical protein
LAHAADRRLKVERLWAFENLSRTSKVLQFIGLKLEAEQPVDDAVETLQKIRRHEAPRAIDADRSSGETRHRG